MMKLFRLNRTASTQLRFGQGNQTFRDFTTNRTVGTGGRVRPQLNTELRSDFILHLVQRLGGTLDQQLVVVAVTLLRVKLW
jgi:hypothetical protein